MERVRIRVVGCMYFGYMLLMFCRMTFSVVSAAIVEDADLEMSTTLIGRILGYASVGTLVGKLTTGFVADSLGGRWTLLGAISGVGLATLMMSFAESYVTFALMLFLLSVVRAAGWPALTKLIGAWIRPEFYSRLWAILATSSRIGVIVSTMAFGVLLAYLHWRDIFALAGILTIVIAIGLSRVFPDRPEEAPAKVSERTSRREILATLRFFAGDARFWLICGSVACTTVLMGLIDFMPLFLRANFGVSAARAAIATSVFPISCLVSVVAAGYFYDGLNRKQRLWAAGCSLVVACLSIAALTWIAADRSDRNIRFIGALGVILVFGASIAPAYYLPPNIFSVEFGGRRSGVLAGFIDVSGYSATAAFSVVAGAIAEREQGWIQFLWLVFAITCFGLITTLGFLYRDWLVSSDVEPIGLKSDERDQFSL